MKNVFKSCVAGKNPRNNEKKRIGDPYNPAISECSSTDRWRTLKTSSQTNGFLPLNKGYNFFAKTWRWCRVSLSFRIPLPTLKHCLTPRLLRGVPWTNIPNFINFKWFPIWIRTNEHHYLKDSDNFLIFYRLIRAENILRKLFVNLCKFFEWYNRFLNKIKVSWQVNEGYFSNKNAHF